jgi:hypothetical protein
LIQLSYDIIYEVNRLNNYTFVTERYGKYKGSYTSIMSMAHKILFIIGRSIDMSSVTGVDDGTGYGVYGRSSTGGVGVVGLSNGNTGVLGGSNNDHGVYGISNIYAGIFGRSESGSGVVGHSATGFGVRGISNSSIGVYGTSGSRGLAAYLDGDVRITGYISKGGGGFKIDHPLDPANKYLYHSFVESPDMKNVYDGVVMLDNKGKAEIELPNWFGALNKDFRYQLTAIGAPGPNLYIAEEISDKTTNYTSNNKKNSRFKIAGGTSGMKVSWQVTGIRKDPWANANRIEVEDDKPAKERGYYLHLDLYGQPKEKGISHLLFPEDRREVLVGAAHK